MMDREKEVEEREGNGAVQEEDYIGQQVATEHLVLVRLFGDVP